MDTYLQRAQPQRTTIEQTTIEGTVVNTAIPKVEVSQQSERRSPAQQMSFELLPSSACQVHHLPPIFLSKRPPHCRRRKQRRESKKNYILQRAWPARMRQKIYLYLHYFRARRSSECKIPHPATTSRRSSRARCVLAMMMKADLVGHRWCGRCCFPRHQ